MGKSIFGIVLALVAGIATGFGLSSCKSGGGLVPPPGQADSCPVSVTGATSDVQGGSPTTFTVVLSSTSRAGDRFQICYAVEKVNGGTSVGTDVVLRDYETIHTCTTAVPSFSFPVGTKGVSEQHKVTITVHSLNYRCNSKEAALKVNP